MVEEAAAILAHELDGVLQIAVCNPRSGDESWLFIYGDAHRMRDLRKIGMIRLDANVGYLL